jgi:membrane-associated phospholipid phosphatase
MSRRALTTAVVCVVLLVVIYLMAVLTAAGQRFEDAVLAGAAAAADAGGHADTLNGVAHAIAVWSLRTVSTPTLVACTAVVIAIGILRRRPLLGLTGAGVVAASVVTAEVVRRVAFRPVLLEHGVRRADQSFPSGHTATAISVLFGLILTMPPRFRTYAVVIVAPWALATSVATVAVGWHRPSDTAGSEVIALLYTCLAIAILGRRTQPGPRASRSSPVTPPRMGSLGGRDRNVAPVIVAAYGLIAAVAMGIMFFDHGSASATVSTSSLAAYVAGRLIVLASGVAVTAVPLTQLRGVDLAERRESRSPGMGDAVSAVGTTATSGDPH